MFGLGNRDQTCETCWKQLPFGYKFLFLFTLGYNALSIIFSFLITSFYFDGYLVVERFQLWRLLIPFFPAGSMPMSMLNILINFLWLLSIFPPMVTIFLIKEKKLSTSYILIETFLQNLLINLALTVISIIAFYIFSLDPEQYGIYNLGLFPLCMIFVWAQAAQNPDQHTTFCCMPCLIPMKWIPVIILAFCLLMSPSLFLPLLIAFFFGYFQFMHFKKRFLKLPVKFYRKIDTLLPRSITERPDYVRVQNVQNDLKHQCSGFGADVGGGINPFSRNQNRNDEVEEGPNRVQVLGKGVSIGGGSSNNQNFKGFWAQKTEDIEIEPTPQKNIRQQLKKPPQTEEFTNFSNDSHLQLNKSSPGDKSQEEFEQKDQKKVAKENLI